MPKPTASCEVAKVSIREASRAGQDSQPAGLDRLVLPVAVLADVVLAVVLAYLLCIWAVAVLYVCQARYTRQGNVWHTVAQLTSDLTEPVLRKADEMTDDTVSEQLKGKDPLVRVGIDRGSGKILVLKA